MESDQITETIAHELGHNFGLPHNIHHDGVMSTIQDDKVRTYYEVYGINVPSIGTQHTHDKKPQDIPTITDSATIDIQQGAHNCAQKCFIPSTVTINVGGTVTWWNKDPVFSHTVVSGGLAEGGFNGMFKSSTLPYPTGIFSHTFEDAGEYPYFCMVHPWMNGVVIVQDTTITNNGQTGTGQQPHTTGELPTNITEFTEHEKTIEFIEFIKLIARNQQTFDETFTLLTQIREYLNDAIGGTNLFNP